MENFDGGPAFPITERNGSNSGMPGMSLREYYAGQLMHGELTTCGVPGEACEALVRAAADKGMDPIDLMAQNAMDGADALIRASAWPPQRVAVPFDPSTLTTGELDAMERMTWWTHFGDLPTEIKDRATKAAEYLKAVGEDDGIPF